MLKYRHDIDGLRAIAVLMVLIFHFDIFGSTGAGFLGVDVFFVISGFLITSIVIHQIDSESFELKQFYLNRIRRLAPALFATLFLVLGLGLIWLLPLELVSLAKQVTVSQLYVSNVYYWRTINYFGLAASSAYLLHSWSLAVEEQFYLLYPAGLMFAQRFPRSLTLPIIAVVALLSFSLNIFFLWSKPEATFYLLPTRAWELLTGALLIYVKPTKVSDRFSPNISGLIGLGLVGASFILFDKSTRFPGFAALGPTLGAAFILLAGTCGPNIASTILSQPPLVYLGRISYPLYLVHWPVTIFCKQLLGERYTVDWRILMFIFSIGLSSIIYHLLENPIRKKTVLKTRSSLLRFYALGLAGSLSASGLIYESAGLPQRFPAEVARLAGFAADRPPELSECESKDGKLRSVLCQIGDETTSPTWLIYGDSHAWATHAAFDRWLKKIGQSGFFVFQHSCPPIEGVHRYHDRGQCFTFNEQTLNFLTKMPQIKSVFMVSIWREALEGLSESENTLPTTESSLRLFDVKFAETLRDLNRLGKHVYVWEPLPGARGNVPEILARAALDNSHPELEFSKEEYFSTFQFFFDAMNRNSEFIAGKLSPAGALCRSGSCSVSLGGTPLYFDNNHPTASSANFWATQLEMIPVTK